MRITGAIMCLAASVLESARYIAAAIYCGNDLDLKESLEEVGGELTFFAVLFAALGLGLIIYGVMMSTRKEIR